MFSLKEKDTADFSNQLPPNINKVKPIAINNKLSMRKLLANIAELGGEPREVYH